MHLHIFVTLYIPESTSNTVDVTCISSTDRIEIAGPLGVKNVTIIIVTIIIVKDGSP